MYEKRKKVLNELLKGRELTGIEIGALDKPLVVRSGLFANQEILYADHLSTQELRAKYKADKSVDLDALVDVDLVSPSADFSAKLGGRSVDYIVASHVVEHVPNPIYWFQMLFKNLRPGGFVFLVVPDKRFTFDYQRPASTFGVMLESFLTNKCRPSVADVFDHHSSAVMIDGSKVWSGLLGPSDLVPLSSNQDALKYSHEVHKEGVYHDVHVSIFTPLSFFSIIERLIHTELFSAEISGFWDTEVNDIEFFVCLKKPDCNQKSAKEKCLSSIPRLAVNTLVSPYMPQVKSLSDSLRNITQVNQEFHGQIQKQREEIKYLGEKLGVLQQVLDRISVKVVLKLMHIFFNFIALFKKKNG